MRDMQLHEMVMVPLWLAWCKGQCHNYDEISLCSWLAGKTEKNMERKEIKFNSVDDDREGEREREREREGGRESRE